MPGHKLSDVYRFAETDQNLVAETEIVAVFYSDGLYVYGLSLGGLCYGRFGYMEYTFAQFKERMFRPVGCFRIYHKRNPVQYDSRRLRNGLIVVFNRIYAVSYTIDRHHSQE